MSTENKAIRKLQISLNPKSDKIVYDFVEKLTIEGYGIRGYENDRIKEILKAWVSLIDMYGEDDTMRLAMLLARGSAPVQQVVHTSEVASTTEEYVEEDVEEDDEHEQDYLAILKGAQQRAEQRRAEQEGTE